MKLKVQEKNEAIRLRKLGYSYKEILKAVPVAKSSLSGWLKHLDYTKKQLKTIELRLDASKKRGLYKSIVTNRNKRLAREQIVYEAAKKAFLENTKDSLFLLGIGLYWAEGTKRGSNFQFMNSSPHMIKLMFNWMRKYMGFEKERIKIRLFIHQVYSHENCEHFWSKILNVPKERFQKTIFKPTPHKVKKNPDYKGCVRLSAGNIDDLRKIAAWQKLLIAYYGSV